MSVLDTLNRWDSLPTLSNVWDLVPYSFVVDWFADIGGMLETCDAALQLSTLDVVGTTLSYKRSYELKGLKIAGMMYDVAVTTYVRSTPSQVILPHPTLSFPGNAKNNLLQLSAIILQKF